MTTATQQRPAATENVKPRHFAMVQSGETHASTSTHSNGNTLVTGLRVFRSGTFKDSWGDQHTWEREHITQMVANFKMLRDGGTLPNIPVREGHPSIFGGGGTVKGYITDLAYEIADHNGEDAAFLVADFEFTDPDGATKWANGTYRARSSEIGMYETNDMALYFPVLMGFAFVDIPAVEGLYEKENQHSTVILFEENRVTQPTAPTTEKQSEHSAPAAPVVPTAPAAPAAPAVQDPFSFMIGGQKVSDFSKVQAHISGLEQFQTETMKQARKDFVKALASSGKILASDMDKVESEVLAMDDSAYSAFSTAMNYAQASSALAPVASGITNSQGQDDTHGISKIDDEIAVQEELIASFGRLNWTKERIEATSAYTKLQALRAQKQSA